MDEWMEKRRKSKKRLQFAVHTLLKAWYVCTLYSEDCFVNICCLHFSHCCMFQPCTHVRINYNGSELFAIFFFFSLLSLLFLFVPSHCHWGLILSKDCYFSFHIYIFNAMLRCKYDRVHILTNELFFLFFIFFVLPWINSFRAHSISLYENM